LEILAFSAFFKLSLHFILNHIHDLMTFITNKQNAKRIWVGPFQFNLIKYVLKTAIFCEKRISLNVEENELMASLCYFQKHATALNWIDPTQVCYEFGLSRINQIHSKHGWDLSTLAS
jgi:hypothetical protein